MNRNFAFLKKYAVLGCFLLQTGIAHGFSVGAINGVTCNNDMFMNWVIYNFSIGKSSTCDIKKELPQFEHVHQQITYESLAEITYYTVDGRYTFNYDMMTEIADTNALTDKDQAPEIHFDNETFDKSITRLIQLQNLIQNQLIWTRKMTTYQAYAIRKNLGGYLHTLQDFFSHSTWVNLHPESNVVPQFWISDATPLAPLPNIDPSPCPDTILGPEGEHFPDTTTVKSGAFTSGYAQGSGFDLNNATAPSGKCAHGLVAAPNTGNVGIHKDWFSRTLHEEAKAQAIYASTQAVKYMLEFKDNYQDNVCMVMTNKPCGTQITVDATTGSTGTGTVTSSPQGITCKTNNNNNCTYIFSSGNTVTLTANPDIGGIVSEWSGDCASKSIASGGSSGTCTVTMAGNPKNITATFGLNVVGTYHLIKYKPSFDNSCDTSYPPDGYIPASVMPDCLINASHLGYDLVELDSGSYMDVNSDGTFAIKTWGTYINERLTVGQNDNPKTGVWTKGDGNNIYVTFVYPNGYRYANPYPISFSMIGGHTLSNYYDNYALVFQKD